MNPNSIIQDHPSKTQNYLKADRESAVPAHLYMNSSQPWYLVTALRSIFIYKSTKTTKINPQQHHCKIYVNTRNLSNTVFPLDLGYWLLAVYIQS